MLWRRHAPSPGLPYRRARGELPPAASTACWDAPRRPRRGHGGEERVRQDGALRGTQTSSAALAEATAKLKKNAHFFLGNTKAHCRNFMVVGFFCPPQSNQLLLGV